MLTLGSGRLKVRLFDPRWTMSDGVAALMPLGRPNAEHARFIKDPGPASPAGFYALVAEGPAGVSAAVDRIRSMPLFYGQTQDGGLLLSDRAEWVRREMDSRELLEGARNDLLLAGYVTGGNTLFVGVKQLQAGQRLDASLNDEGVTVMVSDHFVFKRTFDSSTPASDFNSQLELSLEKAISRLVELADGRQVAVPLSGGNDSRVIAMFLAEMCPKQVVTFAYGRPSLGEVAISKSVADALNLPWHFVEQTPVFWSDLRRSSDVQSFLRESHQFVSAPYMQDWPAVRQLLRAGVIEADAIVAPGHSGDVPTGGMMLPELLADDRSVSTESAIRRFHYSLWPYDLVQTDDQTVERWIKSTSLPSSWGYLGERLDRIGAGDAWNWRERQGKWLVNSVRGFEGLGLTWWMPLWDKEFVELWSSAPLDALVGRRLYRQFVGEKFGRMTGSHVSNYAQPRSLLNDARLLGATLVPAKAQPLARTWFRRLLPPKPGFGKMGWEAWVDPRMLKGFSSRAANITSFAALETLIALESDFPDLVPPAMRMMHERISE